MFFAAPAERMPRDLVHRSSQDGVELSPALKSYARAR
jgi:hypothetical protein